MLDAFKVLPPSIVTKELHKHSLNALKIPLVVVVNSSLNDLFFMNSFSYFCLPYVELLLGLVGVESLECISNLSISFTTQILILALHSFLLFVLSDLEVLQLLI